MSENGDIYRIKTSDDREIVLVGTAHISQASMDLVRETIETEKPDTVCIELDEGRLKSIQDPERCYGDGDSYEHELAKSSHPDAVNRMLQDEHQQ